MMMQLAKNKRCKRGQMELLIKAYDSDVRLKLTSHKFKVTSCQA